jgi:UPF0271 protein
MLIDLNCDLGEGAGTDADVIPLITTANVACFYHAGDPGTAYATLELAAKHGVRAGAHPSFPDREDFGRREMDRTEEQVLNDCVYQIGALSGIARECGITLGHVKPHGALYNMACRDDRMARPVVAAADQFRLPLLGLPNSRVQALSHSGFIPEGFADRRYRPDGSLVPRSEPHAFVHDPAEAAKQALWLAKEVGIRTLCVHGDNPQAVAFVRALRDSLTAAGFTIAPFA